MYNKSNKIYEMDENELDELYLKAKNKKLNLGRVFLVANHLAFKDLSGAKRDFKIKLPLELENWLPKF